MKMLRAKLTALRTIVLATVLFIAAPYVVHADTSALANGIYLVNRDAEYSKLLMPIEENERIMLDDGHLLEPIQPNLPDKPRYVALSTVQFVPINLAHKPTKNVDAQGKKQLMLELAKSEIVPLETFTRKNCGRSVAIVIGNQVVTVHKVREPITGGKMQITRCTDNGCDVLFTQLQKSDADR